VRGTVCCSRVSGNAAYILGTVAEDVHGRERVAGLVTGVAGECSRILPDFVRLFSVEDHETIMNAVGALGTLVRVHSCICFLCQL
jgi:hypothetical protein